MSAIATDTLPQPCWAPDIGICCWQGQHQVVVSGGISPSGTSRVPIADTRFFKVSGLSHVDGPNRPAAGACAAWVNSGGAPQTPYLQENIGAQPAPDCGLLVIGGENAFQNSIHELTASTQTWSDPTTSPLFAFSDFYPFESRHIFSLANGNWLAFQSGKGCFRWNGSGWSSVVSFPASYFHGNGDGNGSALRLGNGNIMFCDVVDVSFETKIAWTIFDGTSWSAVQEVLVANPGLVGIGEVKACHLDANRALIVFTVSVNPTTTAYAYLFDGATWTVTGTFTPRRYFALCGSRSGEAFCVGGFNEWTGVPSNLIEKWSAGTWGGFDTLPTAAANVSAIVATQDSTSRLYCLGGFTGTHTSPSAQTTATNQVAIYNVTTEATQPTVCTCSAGPHDCPVFDTRNPCSQGGADALGQWYAWQPPGVNPVAVCVHNGIHHYLDADGTVRYEVPGQYFDDTATAILTRVKFAPMSIGGLGGAERVYRIQADGRWIGSHTMRITANIVKGDDLNPLVWTADVDMSSVMNEFEFRPSPTSSTSIELVLEEVASGNLTGGYSLEALSLEVGVSGRMKRINVSQRISG